MVGEPVPKRGDNARRSMWIAAGVILACLIGVAIYGWFSLRGSAMSTIAVIALAAGVVLTLILGVGLMTLLFYSDREGYDEDAGRGPRR